MGKYLVYCESLTRGRQAERGIHRKKAKIEPQKTFLKKFEKRLDKSDLMVYNRKVADRRACPAHRSLKIEQQKFIALKSAKESR